MLQGLRTVVYHVRDLERSKAWYSELLGYGPYFDEPFYVGFDVGGYELGLLPAEPDELPGAVTYWGVANIEKAVAALIDRGANAADPVTATCWELSRTRTFGRGDQPGLAARKPAPPGLVTDRGNDPEA